MAFNLQTKHYKVSVFTNQYMLNGSLEPIGAMVPFLSNPERKNIPFKQVQAIALEPTINVATFTAEEIWIPRDQIVAVQFHDTISQNTMALLPFKDKLRVFLPHLVVQGMFAHGQDTSIGDLIDSIPGMWAPAENARLFVLNPIKGQAKSESQMILLNKRHIQTYQRVD